MEKTSQTERKSWPVDPFAVAAFAIPLFAYWLTLAPTVFWLDAGIYLAAGRELGIAYPPGFPLYVILSSLIGLVPIGEFAQRIHFLSALFGATACLFAYFGVRRLAAHDARHHPVTGAASLVAALGLGFCFSLWCQAVNAEVYSMHAWTTAAVLWAALRLEQDPEPGFWRGPGLFGILCGIGFANHPMIVGMVPAMAIVVYRQRQRGKQWLWAGLVFCLTGFFPYLYIPVRSLANPLTDWGNPESAKNFLKLVTAQHWTAESRSYSWFGPEFWGRVAEAARLLFWQFLPVGLALSLLGAIVTVRRDRWFGAVALSTMLLAFLIPLLYTQTKEFESWFLPAYVVGALFAGAGLLFLLDQIRVRVGAAVRGIPWIAVALAAFLYPALLVAVAVPAVDRSDDRDAEHYALDILRGVGPDGILLISGDNPSSTVLFAQTALGARPDVAVVNQEAMQSPWYRDHVRNNLDLQLDDPPTPGPVTAEWLTDIVLSLMSKNPERPLYALMPSHLALPKGFVLSPSGMVFRLSTRSEPAPFERWDFGFEDGQGPFATWPKDQRKKIDDARREMKAGYLRAYSTGADFFLQHRQFRHAQLLYEKCVALVPDHEDFRLRLGVSLVQQRRLPESEAAFRELVERLPHSYQGWYNLGNVLAEQGRLAEARQAYLNTLRIKPDYKLARRAISGLR